MKINFVQKLKSALALFFIAATLSFFSNSLYASEQLNIVPSEKVCMVTNMLFPRTQIPVAHAGKTYYGCCENCKKTLSEDSASRSAVDPVSGKSVDKASAVIAARDDGSVVYFESKKTFETYKNKSVKKKSN